MDIKHKIQFGCNADELAMKVLSGKKQQLHLYMIITTMNTKI